MKLNMGFVDRAVRSVLAVVVLWLLVAGVIEGVLAIVLAALATAFILTSAVAWCPIYAPFGLSTRKKEG